MFSIDMGGLDRRSVDSTYGVILSKKDQEHIKGLKELGVPSTKVQEIIDQDRLQYGRNLKNAYAKELTKESTPQITRVTVAAKLPPPPDLLLGTDGKSTKESTPQITRATVAAKLPPPPDLLLGTDEKSTSRSSNTGSFAGLFEMELGDEKTLSASRSATTREEKSISLSSGSHSTLSSASASSSVSSVSTPTETEARALVQSPPTLLDHVRHLEAHPDQFTIQELIEVLEVAQSASPNEARKKLLIDMNLALMTETTADMQEVYLVRNFNKHSLDQIRGILASLADSENPPPKIQDYIQFYNNLIREIPQLANIAGVRIPKSIRIGEIENILESAWQKSSDPKVNRIRVAFKVFKNFCQARSLYTLNDSERTEALTGERRSYDFSLLQAAQLTVQGILKEHPNFLRYMYDLPTDAALEARAANPASRTSTPNSEYEQKGDVGRVVNRGISTALIEFVREKEMNPQALTDQDFINILRFQQNKEGHTNYDQINASARTARKELEAFKVRVYNFCKKNGYINQDEPFDPTITAKNGVVILRNLQRAEGHSNYEGIIEQVEENLDLQEQFEMKAFSVLEQNQNIFREMSGVPVHPKWGVPLFDSEVRVIEKMQESSVYTDERIQQMVDSHAHLVGRFGL